MAYTNRSKGSQSIDRLDIGAGGVRDRKTGALLSSASSTGLPLISAANALTAFAGGEQASATPMTKAINRFTVVATAADSAKLPAAEAGLCICVINDSANSMQVFGAGADTIDGVAAATGKALAAGKRGEYVCAVAGLWQLFLGA